MIAIINRGGDQEGVCSYTVSINKKVVASFTHNRYDGLAECLRKAADAVDQANPEGGHLCAQCRTRLKAGDGALCHECLLVNIHLNKEEEL